MLCATASRAVSTGVAKDKSFAEHRAYTHTTATASYLRFRLVVEPLVLHEQSNISHHSLEVAADPISAISGLGGSVQRDYQSI
jgi:hypothetical protein